MSEPTIFCTSILYNHASNTQIDAISEYLLDHHQETYTVSLSCTGFAIEIFLSNALLQLDGKNRLRVSIFTQKENGMSMKAGGEFLFLKNVNRVNLMLSYFCVVL